MPFSLPLNLIVKLLRWIFSAIEKKFLLPIYRRSHNLWIERHRLGARWQSCGQHLEYSIYLATATDRLQISRIAFRSKQQKISKLSMMFEAASSSTRFQEHIHLLNIDQKPIVWTFTHIQTMKFTGDENKIRFSWDEYSMLNIQIALEDGENIPLFNTVTSHLTHTWLLNSTWTYKWGRYWNLDIIRHAKTNLKLYWRFGFGLPSIRKYGPRSTVSNSRPSFKEVIIRPLATLMATDVMLAIQFWTAIWSGLFKVTEDSKLEFRIRRKIESNDL